MPDGLVIPNTRVGPQALRRKRKLAGQRHLLTGGPASAEIVIPQSATVFTLVGLDYQITDYMPQALQGYFADSSKYNMQHLDYPASLAANSIPLGMQAIDDAVRNTSGPKIVFAHSQGCQCCKRWIDANTTDPTAPNDITFVFIGDLLRATGGGGIGTRAVDGVIEAPMPTACRWPIVDIARRWDGWADPNQISDKWADKNTKSGKAKFHTHYENVNIFDPLNTVWRVDNTTFILTHEDMPPVISSWILQGPQGIAVKNAFQLHVERFYISNRITNSTFSQTVPLNSYWVNGLSNMGVLP